MFGLLHSEHSTKQLEGMQHMLSLNVPKVLRLPSLGAHDCPGIRTDWEYARAK